MRIKANLSKTEKDAIRSLVEDKSIVISPADKGRAVVIEDRETYIRKIKDQINEGDYVEIKRSEASILRELQKRISDQLREMGLTEVKQRRPFMVTSPRLAAMYVLIKIHKENHPGRPVVCQTNDPTYNLCKELTRILAPLSNKGHSFIRNSSDLKKHLEGLVIDEDCRLASFDVKSLYPSIPVQRALLIIRTKLEEDEDLTRRTNWSIENIMRLLELCLITYFTTLDGSVWMQTDGCPIGKSISGEIAEFFMNWFEEQHIFCQKPIFLPVLWKRMRDDIFLIWRESKDNVGSIDQVLQNLNQCEDRLKFTMEKEENGCLAFLDMMIMRKDGKLETKVYRKDTHTQRYIHWRSNHPKNVKSGVVKTLTHRAHEICDSKEDLITELKLLEDTFIENEYPKETVKTVIEDSWVEELRKLTRQTEMEDTTHDSKGNGDKTYYDVLHAPYIPGFTEKLQKKLRKINVGFVMKRDQTLQSRLCRSMKPPVLEKDRKDVVYSIGCKSCELEYVGETSKTTIERRKQHMSDVRRKIQTNAIFMHVKENKGHVIDWEGQKIISHEPNWLLRKLKESIVIEAMNPTEELVKIMNLEKGFQVDNCWKGLAKEVLESLS
jgi:hypothetical protein